MLCFYVLCSIDVFNDNKFIRRFSCPDHLAFRWRHVIILMVYTVTFFESH